MYWLKNILLAAVCKASVSFRAFSYMTLNEFPTDDHTCCEETSHLHTELPKKRSKQDVTLESCQRSLEHHGRGVKRLCLSLRLSPEKLKGKSLHVGWHCAKNVDTFALYLRKNLKKAYFHVCSEWMWQEAQSCRKAGVCIHTTSNTSLYVG